MAKSDKRSADRKKVTYASFIRKDLPGGGYSLMQFMSRDLSEGGIFICTDDLSVFDLGDELQLIVEKDKSRYFEGRAQVVRSVRTFGSDQILTDSGFGLMFSERSESLEDLIRSEQENSNI